MRRRVPSIWLLRNIVDYDHTTGLFTWRERSKHLFNPGNTGGRLERASVWNRRYAGMSAFISVKDNGYLYGRMFDRNFYAHRVAWAHHHGEWPEHEVDHINGVRTDNRIINLRSVTHSENIRNSRPRRGVGFTGLYLDRSRGLWTVQINGKHAITSKCVGIAMRVRNREYRARGFSERHMMPKVPEN